MRRLYRLLVLGRLAEKVLLDEGEEIYLKPWNHHGGRSLRVDGEWPLTPAQTRLIADLLRRRVE